MSHYRYVLEPYISQKNRYECPSCGKRHVFTRYVDLEKKTYVALEVGKCDREQKCGYHLSPKEYFRERETFAGGNKLATEEVKDAVFKRIALKASQDQLPVSFVEHDLLKQSLETSSSNHLFSFLQSVISPESLIQVKEKYKIGTSEIWKGATIFWQIDQKGRIRTGKIMLYDKATGRKKKLNWVHSVLNLSDYNLKQCLFGLHLLNSDKQKTIAIVESEKTAVIASIAFPQFIWMATGGLMNLKASMLKPLINRRVVLFPDAGCYEDWNNRVASLPATIEYLISDLVERKSTAEEKQEGRDIADYIIEIWRRK